MAIDADVLARISVNGSQARVTVDPTRPQLECRICITWWPGTGKFELAMADPVTGRVQQLGRHPMRDMDRIVGDLRRRIETERHRVTYSEVTGPR